MKYLNLRIKKLRLSYKYRKETREYFLMDERFERDILKIKLIILGDPYVGKSSLMERYIYTIVLYTYIYIDSGKGNSMHRQRRL